MTTVLILIFSALWLITTKKNIKRETVELYIRMVWKAILVLVMLEGALTIIHFIEDWIELYFTYKMR